MPDEMIPASIEAVLPFSLDKIQEDYPDAAIKELARAEAITANAQAGRPRIYAEGDSWFDFPWWIILNRCSDILDALLFEHRYEVHRDSRRGHKLSDMIQLENLIHLRSRIKGLAPEAFLISGGGNDLFAGGKDCDSLFYRLLRQAEPDPEKRIDKVMLDAELDFLMGQIGTLIQIAHFEEVPVVVHGYGLPPQGVYGRGAFRYVSGPWIKPVLTCRGYSDDQGEEIVKTILDAFNTKLAAFVAPIDQVAYVDLREDLSDEDLWHDELHLYAGGWRKAGVAFDEALKGLGVSS